MRIVFMGTPQAAVPSLERLLSDGHDVAAVYTQPDRPSGRGNKISHSPVKAFALQNDLPVFQPVKIRTPEALAEFRSHSSEVAVVVAYGRILPETFLTTPENGAINVHFSLLPKYRGAAPVNWAIARGESETGVTTMQMDAGLDTGPVLLQRATAIGDRETAVDLMDRLSVIGADLLSDTLRDLLGIIATPQNHENATMAPIMKREDGLIDWDLSARQISDRVRGFQPFPTTYTLFRGQRLTIWKANALTTGQSGKVGEIVLAVGDELIVNCGRGTVFRIDELQSEGKRRMATRDYLNGVNIVKGDVFGT